MRIQIQKARTGEWDILTEDGSVRIISEENRCILIELWRLNAKGDPEAIRLRLNAREINWFYQRASAAGFYQQDGGGVLPDARKR